LAGALGCLLLSLGLPSWLARDSGQRPVKTRSFQELSLALKAMTDDRQGLELTGPAADQGVRFEPEGLRITLPAGYAGAPGWHGQERPDAGVIVPVAVKGDFQVTVSFEILREPEPEDAGYPQTRFSLDAGVDRGTNTVTALSRRVEQGGGTQFLTWAHRVNP